MSAITKVILFVLISITRWTRHIWYSFIEWWYDNKVSLFVRSLRNYLALYKAGLLIVHYVDPDLKGQYERWRFMWRGRLMPMLGDIGYVRGRYNVMLDGKVESLEEKLK